MNEQEVQPDLVLSIAGESVGDRRVLTVSGELDMATAPRLEAAVEELLDDDELRRVVIDLSGTVFVDSSGLRAILSTQRRLQELGREFSLRAPSPPVTRLLEITALVEHFTIED